MHAIPEALSLEKFAGRELEMICCTASTTTYHFGADALICAGAGYVCQLGKGGRETVDQPLRSTGPLELIGRTVLRALPLEDRRTLRLEFDDGSWLAFTSEAAYESFEVILDGKRHIM